MILNRIKDILRRNSFVTKLYYKIKPHDSKRKKVIRGNNNAFNNMGLATDVRRFIVGNNNYIENGVNSNFSNSLIHIEGNNNKVIIGANTIVDKTTIWIEGDNCRLIIGNDCHLAGSNFGIVEDGQYIEVGNECLISYDTEFKTSDSHYIIDLETDKRINPAQSIKVEDHVWIGTKVSVMKGVTIHRESIVGTNAVVTKDVPANTIVAGIPAKATRTNVTWRK